MEVSIPRWISSAADGTLDMTVGSLLPVAPPNHLAAVHVTSVRRSTTQAKWLPTAATGAGRFMLTCWPPVRASTSERNWVVPSMPPVERHLVVVLDTFSQGTTSTGSASAWRSPSARGRPLHGVSPLGGRRRGPPGLPAARPPAYHRSPRLFPGPRVPKR